MSEDSEATSDRTPSVCMGSDNNLSSHSRLKYMSEYLLVSDKEPASEEASPSG